LAVVSLLFVVARPPSRPTTVEIEAAYRRADSIGSVWASQAAMMSLEPAWIPGENAFWYRRDRVDGTSLFLRVDAKTGEKSPLFDAKALATALEKRSGKPVDSWRLPFRRVQLDGQRLTFEAFDQRWTLNRADYTMESAPIERKPERAPDAWIQDTWPPNTEPVVSPDGRWTAQIRGEAVFLTAKDVSTRVLATDGTSSGYYARLTWTPDSRRLLAVKVHPGERNKVYLIQTSPPVWGPAQLQERIYDRPGDRVDTFEIVSLDLTGTAAPTLVDTVEYSDLPWFRATPDGALTYTKMDRGYGRFRIMRIDPATGTARAIFDDDPATFVDSTALIQEYVDGSNEIIVSSERDGWHHLYLADGKGSLSQITNGPWVVRGVERVDAKARQIVFRASGMTTGEDPYNVHFYRIGFDGTGLVSLTPAPGNHRVSFSPDQTVLVDTYSTVQNPPVFELRNAETGGLIATVDRGDISPLAKDGWRAPEPFRAKGRDGVTDIYGVVYWPTNFDRRKRYPIVEDIYAGPQDSFVPKSFAPNRYQARLAELGFVVVQIDGMGTRNRSKAFHDVCYQNLADAGLPDRILWMMALAKKYPAIDLSRVGVFGTSAGGQNAGAAVLFHPEFYKVAVASCGCHDNRLDKIWWNEQWMGMMGAHYEASSNIENAGKLQGDLLLMVGELDTNVPTESTFRFAAALQAAGKEYELVVIPNSDHTAGGPYGERKRRDFLVRHLLGVEPPNPNRKGPTP